MHALPSTMQSNFMLMTDTDTELAMREVPVPQPGPGQLLLRMRAAGLNRGEFVLGHGLHGPASTWKAIGGEGAGEVVALGAGVNGFAPGDRVMGRCPGAFSEYAVMDVGEAMHIPTNMDWASAAAVPMTFHVAYDMIVVQSRLQADEWMLVNGIASGVGVASLQIAKVLGAKVIGTSGTQAKLDVLKPLGLDVPLCTRAADFAPRVMEITGGKGVQMVVNAVGGSVFAEDVRCMAFQGRFAMVGYVDGVLNANIDLEALHARRLRFYGVSNKMRTKEQRAAAVPSFIQDIVPHLASGRIQPLLDKTYAFDQLAQAKARMEADVHAGKIVLTIGS
jgi:NADPH:quinone reductase-like Zn-dependent oxidoreductase